MVGSFQEDTKEQQETRNLIELIQLLKANELTKAANWLLHECCDVLKEHDIWSMTMMVGMPSSYLGICLGQIRWEGTRYKIDKHNPEYIEAMKAYRREYQQLKVMENIGSKPGFTYKGEKYKYLDTVNLDTKEASKIANQYYWDRPKWIRNKYGRGSVLPTVLHENRYKTTLGKILSESQFPTTFSIVSPGRTWSEEDRSKPWVKGYDYCIVEGKDEGNTTINLHTYMQTHAIVAIIGAMKTLLFVDPQKYEELNDYLVSFEAQALLAGFILAPEEDDKNENNDEV